MSTQYLALAGLLYVGYHVALNGTLGTAAQELAAQELGEVRELLGQKRDPSQEAAVPRLQDSQPSPPAQPAAPQLAPTPAPPAAAPPAPPPEPAPAPAPPPAPTPPPPAPPAHIPVDAQPSVIVAKRDLSAALGVAFEAIRTLAVEARTFTDHTLGCPLLGVTPYPVTSSGWAIFLSPDEGTSRYEYHAKPGHVVDCWRPR